MTNMDLARSYLFKAQKRLKALAVLRDEGAHSDVVREAQELVERAKLPRAAGISKRLRRERELALDGDIDFIPTEEYSATDAERAYEDAAWIAELAGGVIPRLPS